MKTYIVEARTFTNPSRLHSIDKESFETPNLSEAISVYEKEVETLSKTYTPIDELDYQPSYADHFVGRIRRRRPRYRDCPGERIFCKITLEAPKGASFV